MSIRTERVARLMQREVADLLARDFADQFPTLVTITHARVTRDLSILYLNVSLMAGGDSEREAAFQHLESLTPKIRSALARRVRNQVRKVPEVRFFLDESLEKAKRLEKLFDEIREAGGGNDD